MIYLTEVLGGNTITLKVTQNNTIKSWEVANGKAHPYFLQRRINILWNIKIYIPYCILGEKSNFPSSTMSTAVMWVVLGILMVSENWKSDVNDQAELIYIPIFFPHLLMWSRRTENYYSLFQFSVVCLARCL